ncbi:hypothetical protein E2320_015418 [Naja naja]|nr:hypothetical protein E2320_015418 [Naja naja]
MSAAAVPFQEAEAAGALQAAVAEVRVLLGLQPQAGQAGVASVPVDAVRGARRAVGAGGSRHGRVEGRAAQVVEAGVSHARHGRRAHGGRHAHRGQRAGRREHGLGRRQRAHGVEEGEALGGERRRRQALGVPVVGRVARVYVVVGLHQAAELRHIAVLAEVHLLVAFPLPPLCATLLAGKVSPLASLLLLLRRVVRAPLLAFLHAAWLLFYKETGPRRSRP